jgi:hypothetical protein
VSSHSFLFNINFIVRDYANHINEFVDKSISPNLSFVQFYIHRSFTSDHGDLLGEHGRFNKNTPFRTSAGIPFILRYPAKVQKGKIIQSATSSVDFAPSILSLMGVNDHGVQFDGIDFSNEVMGTSLVSNDHRARFTLKKNWIAVIKNELKLVVSKGDVPWLFDLNADPFEVENMFDNPSYAEIREVLLSELFVALQDDGLNLEVFKPENLVALFWTTPACLDSRDSIQVNSDFFTCEDIGTSLSIDKCSEQAFMEHCPVTCKNCCEDSIGDLWYQGELRTCEQFQEKIYCNRQKVGWFCPSFCGTCYTKSQNMWNYY